MKKTNKKQMDQLLSQYIDGRLPDDEVKKTESLLSQDESARERLKELKRLKDLLSLKPKLTPDIGFWTRFETALEKQKQEEYSLLPFQRKFIPIMSIAAAAVVVVIGTIVIQNRMQFIQYYF